jgi:hypothetical protein
MVTSWIQAMSLGVGIIGITEGVQAMKSTPSGPGRHGEKEDNGWVTKGFRPSKDLKEVEPKKNSEDFAPKIEKKGVDKQNELKWDSNRKMFYYGNLLPVQNTAEKIIQPLKEDDTGVIYKIDQSKEK